MRRRRRHLALAVAPALAAVAAAGAAAGALAAVLAERLVTPRRRLALDHRVLAVSGLEQSSGAPPAGAPPAGPLPAGPLPAGPVVTMAADDDSFRPGRYGLVWPGGHAVVGPPAATSARAVTRPLERLDEGALLPGKVRLGHVAYGDPLKALGLSYSEVCPASDVGALPCWEVPAAGDTWVLLAHGYGGTRASALDFLEIVHRLGMPALALSYRNDDGAPPSADGRYHLGDSEWRDVEAAMEHAVSSGAKRLVLMGWSMGGATVLQALLRARHRELVAGLVLDSPVLDWRAVLVEQGARRHVPPAVVRLACRLVERRVGIDFDAFDWTTADGAVRLDRPALVLHGSDDPLVPVGASRSFAAAAPGLVELHVTPGAGHVGSWNADPAGYEAALAGFLTGLGVTAAGEHEPRRRRI